MTKKWFEEWQIKMDRIDHKRVLSIFMPNRDAEHSHLELFEGQKLTADVLEELGGIVVSAFDQIQRDNGGYKS